MTKACSKCFMATTKPVESCRSNDLREIIKPLLTEYLLERTDDGKYRRTYKEIAEQLRSDGILNASEPNLKKWIKEWDLPKRNFSAADKRKWDVTISGRTKQSPPLYRIQRQRREDERRNRAELLRVRKNPKILEIQPLNLTGELPEDLPITSDDTYVDTLSFAEPSDFSHLSEVCNQLAREQPTPGLELDGHEDGSNVDATQRSLSKAEWTRSISRKSNQQGNDTEVFVHVDIEPDFRFLEEENDADQAYYSPSEMKYPRLMESIWDSGEGDFGMTAYVKDKQTTTMNLHNARPERVIPIFLDKAVHAATEFAIKWSFESSHDTTRISNLRTVLTPRQTQELQSWRAYSMFYNATEMLQVGNKPHAKTLLGQGTLNMLQAFSQPSFRVLSNILLICFSCMVNCPRPSRKTLMKTLQHLVSRSRELGIERRWPSLLAIIDAVCHIDVADGQSKIQLALQLLEIMRSHNIHDFDARYEFKEQLIKLRMELQDWSTARDDCLDLLNETVEAIGYHSDYTYRVRRLDARIGLRSGRINAAEYQLKSLHADSVTYKDEFVESAAQKEWDVWENLAEIARLRGCSNEEDEFFQQALHSSADSYCEGNANTVRILKAYLQLLESQGRFEDMELLGTQYPAEAELLRSASDADD